MPNILLIFVALLLGILLQRIPDFPDNAPKTFNAYLIYTPQFDVGDDFGPGRVRKDMVFWKGNEITANPSQEIQG